MVRKYRCKNWPRAGISSVSRVSARSSRNESSTGICDITGSPGLGISNPLNLSIPQRGIGIADEFWKPQNNLPPIIHVSFWRINRGLTCPVTHYKGLRGARLLRIPGRLEKPRIPIAPFCLPISRKAVTVRCEGSLPSRRKFVGLGQTIDLTNQSPVYHRTLYLFTLGGLSGIFKKLRTGIPGAED